MRKKLQWYEIDHELFNNHVDNFVVIDLATFERAHRLRMHHFDGEAYYATSTHASNMRFEKDPRPEGCNYVLWIGDEAA